jgi:hypothetical protein
MKPEDIPLNKFEQLLGFDCDLVGLQHCGHEFEIEDDGQPWVCPFKPECGATHARDCRLARQYAAIHEAPQRMQ